MEVEVLKLKRTELEEKLRTLLNEFNESTGTQIIAVQAQPIPSSLSQTRIADYKVSIGIAI